MTESAIGMTHAEHVVLNRLTEAWNLFASMPPEHPDELSEYRLGIHALQSQILSRPTRRRLNAALARQGSRPPLGRRQSTPVAIAGDPPPGRSAKDTHSEGESERRALRDAEERNRKASEAASREIRREEREGVSLPLPSTIRVKGSERKVLEILIKGEASRKSEIAALVGKVSPTSVPAYVSFLRSKLRPYNVTIDAAPGGGFLMAPAMAERAKALLPAE